MKKILFSMAMLVLTTVAFSQNCIRILSSSGFSGTGPYTFTVDYVSEGNKTLELAIYCIGNPTPLVTDCFSVTGPGTKTYPGLVCSGGIGNLYTVLTFRTGSCNSAICGTTIVPTPAGAPTPVKLSSFSAVRSKQVVALSWNTEFEIDAKEFIVERAEGTAFRSVGTISTNGNSSTRKSYSFNDKNENTGTTFYRLRNVDLNGTFTYSEIRTVKGIGAVNDVTVFPNPARSNSKISVVGVTANSSIQLLDFSGKVLKNMNSTTINSLDLSGVKNGTYLIRIIDKSTNETVNKTLTVSN
jgi:hypothetical protein